MQLTSFGGPLTHRPRWSPDGQRIVFYSDAPGNRDIYVMRPDSSVTKPLTKDPSIDKNPGWSADGKWIYFGPTAGPRGLEGARRMVARRFRCGSSGRRPSITRRQVPLLRQRLARRVQHLENSNNRRHGNPCYRLGPSLGSLARIGPRIYFISEPDENGISSIRFKDLDTGSIRAIAPIEGRVHWGLRSLPTGGPSCTPNSTKPAAT